MARGMLLHLARVVALALATAACWWIWMAWDHTHQHDPATGAASGPYQAWQVVGCGVCLVALAVFAARRLHPLVVSAVMTVAFTAAWSATATATDVTGLWAVGAMLVFVGTAVSSAVVAALARVWLGRVDGPADGPAGRAATGSAR